MTLQCPVHMLTGIQCSKYCMAARQELADFNAELWQFWRTMYGRKAVAA